MGKKVGTYLVVVILAIFSYSQTIHFALSSNMEFAEQVELDDDCEDQDDVEDENKDHRIQQALFKLPIKTIKKHSFSFNFNESTAEKHFAKIPSPPPELS